MSASPRNALSVRRLMMAAASLCVLCSPAHGMDLPEALSIAVKDNPDIGEAIANRRATEQELEQARGLYLPSVDFEASIGPELRDSRVTRLAGTDGDWFTRRDASLSLRQLLYDGGGTDAEYDRQASRLDAASFRVMERTELIGLDVTEAYLDVLRQLELVQIAAENVRYHDRLSGNLRGRSEGGVGRLADRQQSEERLEAARVTAVEIARSLDEARNRFRRLLGVLPEELVVPSPVSASLPGSLDEALSIARESSPTLRLARSDVDTARAEYDAADSRFYPTLNVEVTGRTGEDLEGDNTGTDSDVRALLVLRYNIFRGGIDTANLREQVHRQSESQQRLAGREREVEELMRNAWDSLDRARERRALLERQVSVSKDVVTTYGEEFRVGRRALLDSLDAQNALVGAQVDYATARYAEMLAEYRVLAIAGRLLDTVGVDRPAEAASFSAGR